MILYLALKFLANTLVFIFGLGILPLLLGMDLSYLVPRVFFFGALFAVIYTYRDFRNRNIWVLYDNLRIHKSLVLLFLFLAVQVVPALIYSLL